MAAITHGQGRKRTPIHRRGATQYHDNSVRVSQLSPEELEYYRSGKHGGKSMENVLTKDKFIAYKEEQGLTNIEIQKKYGINAVQLNKMVNQWGLVGKYRNYSKKREENETAQLKPVNDAPTPPLIKTEEPDLEKDYRMKELEQQVKDYETKIEDLDKEIIKLMKKLNSSQESSGRKPVEPETTRTAKIVEVIETVSIRGNGVETVLREVTQYWSKAGVLLAEMDPVAEEVWIEN